jgi:Tfp pilus assembly protein PilO
MALGIALVLNVLVYALLVYPLSKRVNSVAERTQAAETELTAARTQHALAAATLTGKDKAAKELEAFYTKVLPADLASARQMVFPQLEQLARQSNVRSARTSTDEVFDKEATLTRLKIVMSLVGSYQAVRRFIDALERQPEFFVLDDVTLTEASDPDGELTLKLELSTYYRGGRK